MVKHRASTTITHREICRAVSKISAYLRQGNEEKAREWAEQLVTYMVTMSLYPSHIKIGFKKNKIPLAFLPERAHNTQYKSDTTIDHCDRRQATK